MKTMKTSEDIGLDKQRDQECGQGSPSKALKRKLPAPPEATESFSGIKKRRHSLDDVFLGRKPPLVGEKCLETKFATVPQRARKRPALPVSVNELFGRFGNKKEKLSDVSDNRTPSLCGADPTAERTRLDGHRNLANKRPCSSASDCYKSLEKKIKVEQTTGTWQEENGEAIKSEQQKIIDELRDIGVRVLGKRDVKVMTDAFCEVLGEGSYGSCIKTVDPHTHNHLVIKTIFNEDFNNFFDETKNLFKLQMAGVQRLVGVCVEDCQIISHFAGVTLEEYFNNTVPLADATAIFLQVMRTMQRIAEKGYMHNDLHTRNICVLNGSSGPLATIVDFGIACTIESCYLVDWQTSEIRMLGVMMDTMLKPDKKCIQHPLVDALIKWMDAAILSHIFPEDQPSLAALEEVLGAILEEVSKGIPPGAAVESTQLVLKTRDDNENKYVFISSLGNDRNETTCVQTSR